MSDHDLDENLVTVGLDVERGIAQPLLKDLGDLVHAPRKSAVVFKATGRKNREFWTSSVIVTVALTKVLVGRTVKLLGPRLHLDLRQIRFAATTAAAEPAPTMAHHSRSKRPRAGVASCAASSRWLTSSA